MVMHETYHQLLDSEGVNIPLATVNNVLFIY